MICFDRHNLILIKDSENEEAISFSGANLITGMKGMLEESWTHGKSLEKRAVEIERGSTEEITILRGEDSILKR